MLRHQQGKVHFISFTYTSTLYVGIIPLLSTWLLQKFDLVFFALQVRCCLCRKFGWSWSISHSHCTWLWICVRATAFLPMPAIFVLVTQSKFTGVPVTDILRRNQTSRVHKWKNKTMQIWTPPSWQSGKTACEGWITVNILREENLLSLLIYVQFLFQVHFVHLGKYYNHGLHAGPPVFTAAASQRGYASSCASGSGEDEIQSQMDGRAAGGEAEQGLPGNPCGSLCADSEAEPFLQGFNLHLLIPRLQVPVGLTLSPRADDLGGPSSAVAVLEGYNSLISDSLSGVSQVKSEISSLTGYLKQWRQVNCKEQWPKTSAPGPLQELQSRKEFIHTVSIEALLRVKEFLNLLLKNLDQLETCWKTEQRL